MSYNLELCESFKVAKAFLTEFYESSLSSS